MKNFFRDLLQYSYEQNSIYIHQLLHQGVNPSEKAQQLMSHIINAQHIWNHRIQQKTPTINVWTLHKISQLATLDDENFKESLRILDQRNLETIVDYKNSKQVSFSNSIQEIFFHIVNHSNYHRAQIASELVAQGITPPISDYIVYKR